MSDKVFSGAAYLHSLFFPLRSDRSDYAFYVIEVIVWAEALTAIGAAYAKRMIPLRSMAMLNNLLGILSGVSHLSLTMIFEHAVNFPLNAARLKEMRRLNAPPDRKR